MAAKNTICLWYDAAALDAATFYAETFPDSAVKAVNGDLTRKDAIRDALRKANYKSVRGDYKYGNNHFPIQNFYLQEAVKDDGGALTLKTTALALKHHQDLYHDRCKMKW